MELSGNHCVVREWRTQDVDALVQLADNPAIWRGLRDLFPHPYNRSDAIEWVEYSAVAERELPLAIASAGGELLGSIGLAYGSDVARFSAEIGYWVGAPFWGRGIATEAVHLLTGHAFGHLNLLRVFALPFADNRASCRVLEKAGFECEGRLRASAVKAGGIKDQYLYARINPAWRGLG